MYKYIVFALLVMVAGCKKEGELDQLSAAATTGALSASASQVVLTTSNDADTVLSFHWPAANFGTKVAVTYTLELDLVGDTSSAGAGGAAWGKARSFVISSGPLSYGFAGKDLNNLLNSMGLTPGSPNAVVARVVSTVNQYNGSGSTVAPAYSNTVLLSLNPYGLNLYVPGAYQNWTPATAPVLAPLDGKAGLYEGFVNLAGSGPQHFKYTSSPDWNHTNYGDNSNGMSGIISTNGLASALIVPNPGFYELTADLNKLTWTATATVWGIIGDATPGGWNNDTPMSYDATNQVWTVTANMKTAGSFKFRANNAWNIDFGIDNSGKLVYADNSFFGYTSGLNNLTVSSDGNYTIILDLHVAGKYTYQLNKN